MEDSVHEDRTIKRKKAAFFLQAKLKSNEEKLFAILTELYNCAKLPESNENNRHLRQKIIEKYEEFVSEDQQTRKQKEEEELEQKKREEVESLYREKKKKNILELQKFFTYSAKRDKQHELEFVRKDEQFVSAIKIEKRSESEELHQLFAPVDDGVDPSTLPEAQRTELTRRNVLREIIVTEADYIFDLELLIQVENLNITFR